MSIFVSYCAKYNTPLFSVTLLKFYQTTTKSSMYSLCAVWNWYRQRYVRFVVYFLVICFSPDGAAQEPQRDSLDKLLNIYEHRTDTVAARVLSEIAMQYLEFDSPRSLDIAKRAERLVADVGVSPGRIRILLTLGVVYRADNKYAEASRCFERALVMARDIVAESEIAAILFQRGLIRDEQGKYDEALQDYSEAMQYGQRLQDNQLIVLGLIRLAGLYHYTKKYIRADSLYAEALNKCTDERYDYLRATVLNNYGLLCEARHQPERALLLYRNALVIERRWGRLRGVGRLYNNIGALFLNQEKFDSALVYQREALRLYEKTRYNAGLSNLLGTIAQTQNRLGRHSEAIVSARRALEYVGKNDFKPEQVLAYQVLSDAYTGLGDYKSALAMMKNAATLQDSMYSVANAQKLAELETAQKEQEIKLLQSQRVQENIIRNALGLGAIALVAFAVVLVRSNRQSKRDNLRLQELNEKLFDANEELSLLTSEKDEILNIVTHGLKSQIFGVRTIAELIRIEAANLNFLALAEMSAKISTAAGQMFSSVTNLLTMNEVEQGVLLPAMKAVDISSVVERICAEFSDYAATKDIRIHDTHQDNASADDRFVALADERMFREVMENIISNALKYSPRGKNIHIRLSTYSSQLQANNVIRVEVQDEGEGISASDMKKLFGKFARLSAQPTGGEHSTGLGLSIVKKMVEAMNGKVWCESELGKGATFIVELPKASDQ